MRREHWKKRYVPNSCPDCGTRISDPRSDDDFDAIFRAYFGGYTKFLVKKHPRWGIPCWFSYCGKCALDGQIEIPVQETGLYHMVKKKPDWTGGTLTVPFKE